MTRSVLTSCLQGANPKGNVDKGLARLADLARGHLAGSRNYFDMDHSHCLNIFRLGLIWVRFDRNLGIMELMWVIFGLYFLRSCCG